MREFRWTLRINEVTNIQSKLALSVSVKSHLYKGYAKLLNKL